MSDDLVKRLREYAIHMDAWGKEANHDADIVDEAADRIEKLEDELHHCFHRINKLQAALREVKDEHGYGLPLETTRMIDAVLEGQK